MRDAGPFEVSARAQTTGLGRPRGARVCPGQPTPSARAEPTRRSAHRLRTDRRGVLRCTGNRTAPRIVGLNASHSSDELLPVHLERREPRPRSSSRPERSGASAPFWLQLRAFAHHGEMMRRPAASSEPLPGRVRARPAGRSSYAVPFRLPAERRCVLRCTGNNYHRKCVELDCKCAERRSTTSLP